MSMTDYIQQMAAIVLTHFATVVAAIKHSASLMLQKISHKRNNQSH
jgi:hypothetical protein